MQLGLLLVVMLASGGAELVSLGAVLPFLAVLNDPELLWQQSPVQDLAVRLGLTAASQLLLPVTLGFAAAAVLAALIRLANMWLNGRLAAAVGSDLSCEAYRRTLYQPYVVHLQSNSASVITGITAQIGQTVGALNALLQLLTSFVVAVGLLIGLLVIDASIAVAAFLLIIPGFFTDLLGFLLLIPFTRKILFNFTLGKKTKNNNETKEKTIDGEIIKNNKDEL